MKFWICDSSDGQYYVKQIADNGETLNVSETYRSKPDARKNAELVKREAATAPIYDVTNTRV